MLFLRICTTPLLPPPPNTHTHTRTRLFCFGLLVLNTIKRLEMIYDIKTYVKSSKYKRQFKSYWYFQPIIRIRLLSRLEQLTNLGFGEWQLSIYVVLFLLSLYKNLMFIFVFVVVVCPPIFALIDVLFCEIDDLKSHTKIRSCELTLL